MEENKKLYSQTAITIATFFGGPLAAGILVRRNYINLDKEKQGTYALFIGIAATLLLFASIFALPEAVVDKLPSSLMPFVYTAIIYFLVENLQGDDLRLHKENKEEFYSGWRAAGVGGISLLVTVAFIFITVYLTSEDLNFDAAKYDSGIERLIENENKALIIFNHTDIPDADLLARECSDGLALWEENERIVDELSSIENLPTELITQNNLMKRYCELRILQFQLIQKTITEDTDKYESQIQNIAIEIDKILEEME